MKGQTQRRKWLMIIYKYPKNAVQKISMWNLKKARKRIQERIKKARHEKETETHVRENPGIIDKENERPSDQYDMNVQLRSSDLSLVIPPFIGKHY